MSFFLTTLIESLYIHMRPNNPIHQLAITALEVSCMRTYSFVLLKVVANHNPFSHNCSITQEFKMEVMHTGLTSKMQRVYMVP